MAAVMAAVPVVADARDEVTTTAPAVPPVAARVEAVAPVRRLSVLSPRSVPNALLAPKLPVLPRVRLSPLPAVAVSAAACAAPRVARAEFKIRA